MPDLVGPLRVLGLTLIVSGVRNIQQAYVSRQMIFKRFFFATLGGTISGAIIGILMAYSGYGVWALVFQQLFKDVIGTVILWLTVKWRPKRIFSIQRLKGLFSFGWKLLVSSLIDTVYRDIRQLIIGKMYSSSDLAYYNQGEKYTQVLVNNINNSIDSVLLPSMSKEQDNIERVKTMTRRSIKVSTYLMAPLMIGMACCSREIVLVILTDKWLPCVPYMIIFCITYMFYPIHTANLNAIKALGRSDLFLKLEIVKKVVGIILLILSMQFGVMVIAGSLLISCFISQIINSWPNKKLLNYSYFEQIKDILPNIGLACVMGVCVLLTGKLLHIKTTLFILIIQIIVGAVVYILGSKFVRLDSFEFLLSTIKEFLIKVKIGRE